MTDQKPDGYFTRYKPAKPDFYVAWHPKEGSEIDFLKETEESANAALLQIYKDDGWRIRPCKIVFLDEAADQYAKEKT